MELTATFKKEKKRNIEKRKFDVIIIGAGPAGLTTAIYLSRARLSTLLIEKGVIGGLITSVELIENYPGFPTGISGKELAEKLEKQARRFGTEILIGEVTKVDFGKIKKIFVDSDVYEADAVVISMGVKPKPLGVPGEEKFYGRGISYCATCDGPFFKDKVVAVIGCGNSGLQEGLSLLKYAKFLHFIETLPYAPAEKILVERIKNYENIQFHFNTKVKEIIGEERVKGIKLEKATKIQYELDVEGVFVYVGMMPQTHIFKGILDMTPSGYIKTNDSFETNIKGVFAAGDIREGSVKQIAAAVGEGAKAALSSREYINSLMG